MVTVEDAVSSCHDGDLVRLTPDESDIDSITLSLGDLALSPQDRLPTELLSEIFLFCCDSPLSIPPRQGDPSLILTQVCSAWRELVLHVPELWSSIRVSFLDESSVPGIGCLMKEWIARAGPRYPLSISAECIGPFASAAAENPNLISESIVPLIVTNSHRMRHFDLALPFAAFNRIFDLPHNAFPILETVVFRPLLLSEDMVPPDTAFAAWHWPASSVTFNSAPRLRAVTYNPTMLAKISELQAQVEEDIMQVVMSIEPGEATAFFAPVMSLPAAQLSEIRFPFTALPTDVWCFILTQCVRLTHLEVGAQPVASGTTASLPAIVLEHLVYLGVNAFGGGGNDFLDRIVAPSLSYLVLSGPHFSCSSIIAFKLRSDFKLFGFVPVILIPPEDVCSLFQHLPDVVGAGILAITSENWPRSFWEAVGRAEVLPQLQKLFIQPTVVQAPALVDMIAARWEAIEASGSGVFEVEFCDIRPEQLDGVQESLGKLDKYKASGREVPVRNLFFT